MKAARQPCGFTIFETMIFLAISGIMLGVALNLISGKQSQTEFNQGIRQIQSELQTDISYVSDGYYTSATNFHCSSLNGEGYGAISFSPGTSEQGTNFGCQFIGEAIQFAPDGINTEIKTYPVAGAQYADDNQAPVTSFTEAYPQAVTATSADAVEQLPDGITVGSVTDATDHTSPAMIGFYLSSLASGATDSNGGLGVDLLPYPAVTLGAAGDSSDGAEAIISNAASYSFVTATVNPTSGIAVCFNSQSSSLSGVITVGGNQNPNSVDLTIRERAC